MPSERSLPGPVLQRAGPGSMTSTPLVHSWRTPPTACMPEEAFLAMPSTIHHGGGELRAEFWGSTKGSIGLSRGFPASNQLIHPHSSKLVQIKYLYLSTGSTHYPTALQGDTVITCLSGRFPHLSWGWRPTWRHRSQGPTVPLRACLHEAQAPQLPISARIFPG